MTKRVMALLLAALFAISCMMLASCGSNNDTPNETTKTPADATTTPAETNATTTPATETPVTTTPETETAVTTTPATETPVTTTPETETPVTTTPVAAEEPDKETDPQGWIQWLIDDDGETYTMAYGGQVYNCNRQDGTTPCGWEVWGSDAHLHLCYTFDSMDFDATPGVGTEDYAFTFEIWYKDDDVDEPYRMIKTAPWSLYDWGNGSAIYRIPTYDEGMNDLHTDDGEPNDYDMIFIVYDEDGQIMAWKQDWLSVTDSYEAYLQDAITAGIVTPVN